MKTTYWISFCASLFAAVLLSTGCDNRNLPESYGIFAVDGGKPIPLAESGEPKSFSPKVEFIIFDKTVAFGAAGSVKLYKIPLKPKRQELDSGNFSWEKWNRMTENYGREVGAVLAGIPSDAVEVVVNQKPVERKPEMIRVVPPTPLESGRYQLGRIPFFVERDELKSRNLQAARNALATGQLQVAYESAFVVLKLEPGNSEMQKLLDATFAAAFKEANDAIKAKEWKKAVLSALQALQIRPEDQPLRALLLSIPYLEAMQTARDAFAAKEWDKALQAAQRAAEARYNDSEANSLIGEIQYSREIELAQTAYDQNRWDETIKHAVSALSVKPGDSRAADLQAKAAYRKGMQAARQALEERRFDFALENLEGAMKIKPDDEDALALEEKVKNAIRLEPRYFGKLYRALKNFGANGGELSRIWFSRDGRMAVTFDGPNFNTWGKVFESFDKRWPSAHPDIRSIRAALSADGRRIATQPYGTMVQRVVFIMDLDSGKLLGRFPATQQDNFGGAFTKYPRCWAFSNDGEKLAIGYSDNLAVYRVQDLQNPLWKANVSADTRTLGALCFAADDSVLVVGANPIELRDAKTGKVLGQIPGRRGDNASIVELSPDRKTMVLGSLGFSDLVEIINVETGQLIFDCRPWLSYSISPDWKTIAVNHSDFIDFLDIPTGEKLGSRPTPVKTTTIAFTPDGKRLYAGGKDGRIYLWGIEDTEANQKTGMATLNTAIAAHGGSQIQKWKAARVKYKRVITNPGGDLSISSAENYWQFPSQDWTETRFESRGRTQVQIACVNGDKGWRNVNGAVEDLDKQSVNDIREALYRNSVTKLLIPLGDRRYSISALPEQSENVGINVSSRGHPDIRLYFNKKTGLLSSRGVHLPNANDAQSIVGVKFGEYKEINGVKYPSRMADQVENRWQIEIQEVQFYDKIEGSKFSKEGVAAKQ